MPLVFEEIAPTFRCSENIDKKTILIVSHSYYENSEIIHDIAHAIEHDFVIK